MRALSILLAAVGLLAVSPATASGRSLVGSWAGRLETFDADGFRVTFPIHVRLDQLSIVGARAGFVAYPLGPCHGPLVLRGRTRAGAYRLVYHELSKAPRDDCTGGDDRILIRRRGAGMFIRVTDRFGSTSESVIHRHRVSFTG